MQNFVFHLTQKRLLLYLPRHQNIFPKYSELTSFYSTSFYSTSTKKGFGFENILKTCQPPEFFNFASDVFDSHVVDTPSKCALWIDNDCNSRQWSYSQTQRESVRAAISIQRTLHPSLTSKSLKYFKTPKNSSIFVLLPRVPEWWFIYLASLRLGTIFCPVTTLLTPQDIAYRLKTSTPSIVITDDDNMWKIEEAQRLEIFPTPIKMVVPKKRRFEQVTAENWVQYDELIEGVTDSEILSFRNAVTRSSDISMIFYTSGSTGKPKLVGHNHASYGIGHQSSVELMTVKPSDLYWNLSDPGWAKSSFGNFYVPWIPGAGVYIHQMERFEVKKVLEVLCSRPITGFCAPSTFYRSMVQEDDPSLFQFMSLEIAVSGGEAVNAEVKRAWKQKTGMDIIEIYGQTETTAVIGYTKTDKKKEDAMGFAHYGFDVKITDDNGVEVTRGTQGNISIKVKPNRPIGLFTGYLKESENGLVVDEDHKSTVGDVYLTGDLGSMDDEGHIYYFGRSDDIIISAAYRIGPFEVESVLLTHPAVAETAVVASPDSGRGSVVKAFIILSQEFKNHDKESLVKEIQDFCKRETAPYKYPRRIEFVKELPKTISGKILRRELKIREELAHKDKIL